MSSFSKNIAFSMTVLCKICDCLKNSNFIIYIEPFNLIYNSTHKRKILSNLIELPKALFNSMYWSIIGINKTNYVLEASLISRIMSLRRCLYPNSQNWNMCYLTWRRIFTDVIKNLKVERLSWTIWMDPITRVIIRRRQEGQRQEKDMWQQKLRLK